MTDQAVPPDVERRLRSLQDELDRLADTNRRLADTLREARNQIVTLKEEVDRLADPPNGFAVFLARNPDGTADIHAQGRKLRVSVAPGRRGPRPGPGGHGQRGHERDRGHGLRACRRDRHVQGAARGRRPGPGDRAHRRGARGPPGPDPARPDDPRRRLAADGSALRLRLRADPEVRGRGARARGGPRRRLLRHRRPGRADRDDPRRRRAALRARRAVQGAQAGRPEGDPALRPARMRQDDDRQGGGRVPGAQGRRA